MWGEFCEDYAPKKQKDKTLDEINKEIEHHESIIKELKEIKKSKEEEINKYNIRVYIDDKLYKVIDEVYYTLKQIERACKTIHEDVVEKFGEEISTDVLTGLGSVVATIKRNTYQDRVKVIAEPYGKFE